MSSLKCPRKCPSERDYQRQRDGFFRLILKGVNEVRAVPKTLNQRVLGSSPRRGTQQVVSWSRLAATVGNGQMQTVQLVSRLLKRKRPPPTWASVEHSSIGTSFNHPRNHVIHWFRKGRNNPKLIGKFLPRSPLFVGLNPNDGVLLVHCGLRRSLPLLPRSNTTPTTSCQFYFGAHKVEVAKVGLTLCLLLQIDRRPRCRSGSFANVCLCSGRSSVSRTSTTSMLRSLQSPGCSLSG